MALLKLNLTCIPETRAVLTARFQPLETEELWSRPPSRDAGRLKSRLQRLNFAF